MPQRLPPRRRARPEPCSLRGFSLLEVLFVVAILALVGMIALPDPAAGEIYQLKLATVQVQETLRQAREAARRQRAVVEVEVPGAAMLRVYQVNDAVTPRARSGPLSAPASRQPLAIDLAASPVTRQVRLQKTFSFAVIGARNSLYFNPQGLPMYLAANGERHRLLSATLTVMRGPHTRTVQVDPLTARISVQ